MKLAHAVKESDERVSRLLREAVGLFSSREDVEREAMARQEGSDELKRRLQSLLGDEEGED